MCSSTEHPVYPWIKRWKQLNGERHAIEIVSSTQDLSGGDILFLISCREVVGTDVRETYTKSLVIHASDLPDGRGWSPHIWRIIEGCNEITISLFEAEDEVDRGAVWRKENMHLEGHELFDEINRKLFENELKLMDFALGNFENVVTIPQDEPLVTHYRKRTPQDSKIDPHETIANQFNVLRVADPKRFPAFMDYRGYRYQLKLEKIGRIQHKVKV